MQPVAKVNYTTREKGQQYVWSNNLLLNTLNCTLYGYPCICEHIIYCYFIITRQVYLTILDHACHPHVHTCQNEGLCFPLPGNNHYYCRCDKDYYGKKCEHGKISILNLINKWCQEKI